MVKKVLGATIIQMQADISRLSRDLRRATSIYRRQTNQMVRQAQQVRGRISGLFAGITFAGATRGLITVTDDLKRFEGQVRLVTDSQREFDDTFKQVANIAEATRSELGATIAFYTRLARATEELGLSQQQLGAITTTTNKAIQISGATQQEAAAGSIQLAQALASGRLQGDELRSILENLPRVARAIADGLNVPLGKLRELGKEGALTSEAIAAALISQRDKIEEEYQKLPVTIGQSFQKLKNNITLAFREVDTSSIVDGINDLTEAFNDPALVTGIVNVATGLTNLIALATKGISAFGNFGKAIGETFARVVNGPVNDVEGLTKQLEKAQLRLRTLLEANRNSKIPNSVLKSMNDEITRLTHALEEAKAEFVEVNQEAAKTQVDPAAAELTIPVLTGGTKKKKGKTDAERLAESNAQIVAGLQTELALTQALTSEQRLQVELAQGRFKTLDPGQKALARRLVLEREAIELRREEDEKRKAEIAQQAQQEASVLLGLRRQVALTGDATEAERIRFELVEGGYKGFTAGTKKRLLELASEIDAQNAAAAEAERIAKEQEDAAKRVRDTAARFGNTFSSAFEDVISKGGKFRDVLKSIEQDILKLITRILVTEPLQKGITDIFSGFIGGGSGSGGGGFFSSLFGGARAEGGPVTPGKSFLVGERGPELFSPKTAGDILPNNQLATQSPNIIINIQAQDADSFIRSADQVAQESAMIARRAVGRNS